MKKIFNWIKKDYGNVKEAWYYISNGKLPRWAYPIIYIVLSPIGIVLWPIVFIARKYQLYKMHKLLKELEES